MPISLQSNYVTKVFSAFHSALLMTTVSFHTSNCICSKRPVSAFTASTVWVTLTNWCTQAQWKQWFGSYCAPFWTKRRKALPRAPSSSSQDNFPCLMLQEGVMQTRRDVGWVGGLQHGSIFNEKKVASIAWYKHRRLTCALTERDKLERK